MTVQVRYQGKVFSCAKDRPLLFTMQEQHAFIPSSCQNGFCHACLSKVVAGNVPESAQEGLNVSLKEQGCFLPCICKPNEDISMELATKDNVIFKEKGISPFETYTTMVIDKTWLNDDVLRLCLMRPEPLQYKAGQFINLIQPETKLTRSYSLASMPCENFMELHIKRVTDGRMSNWLCDDLQRGENIEVSGPSGACYYQQGNPEQDIILAGVGTGLAPLYGVLRDALESDHQGRIYLFHASLTQSGLYYQNEVEAMVNDVEHLTYIPCVLQGEAPAGGKQGAIDQLIIETLGDCTGKRAYLCGDDVVVQAMKKKLLQNGLTEADILADSFVPSA